MLIYKIEIPQLVQDKIEEQALYIALDKPAVAMQWYDDIFDHIQTLDNMPTRCPFAPENQYIEDEIRHLLIGNYRVLFCIQSDTVIIVDFKGGKQNKPS